MDPIHYLLHLLDQDVPLSDAIEHVKRRHGLSDEAIRARVAEARSAARELLRLTRGCE